MDKEPDPFFDNKNRAAKFIGAALDAYDRTGDPMIRGALVLQLAQECEINDEREAAAMAYLAHNRVREMLEVQADSILSLEAEWFLITEGADG